jgi:hypothetical protein
MALHQTYDVTLKISACRESIMAGLIKGICDKKPRICDGFFILVAKAGFIQRQRKRTTTYTLLTCLAPYICPLIFGFSKRVSGAGGRMFNAS